MGDDHNLLPILAQRVLDIRAQARNGVAELVERAVGSRLSVRTNGAGVRRRAAGSALPPRKTSLCCIQASKEWDYCFGASVRPAFI